jgi:hypothetical protein
MDGSEAQGSAAVVDEAPEQDAPKQPAADPKAQKKDGSQQGAKAPAKEQGPPPWAKDLADRGIEDPRVDQYLREVWQPRMTQHEQQLAEWTGLFGDGGMDAARIGAGLLEALESDPEGTYQQIGELLGLTAAEVEEMAEDAEGEELDGPEAAPEDDVTRWVRERMEQEQAAQQDAQYQQLLDALGQQFEGFDENLFNMAMLAHEGDLDAALQAYTAYHKPPAPKDEAPPTLGDAPAPTPREAHDFSTIGDSIDAFLSEDRARRGK